ncbi:MAG: hypothetical protein ACYYK0_03525 [Candidatus Eutrophobiaceae bacterium]
MLMLVQRKLKKPPHGSTFSIELRAAEKSQGQQVIAIGIALYAGVPVFEPE